MDFQLQLMTDKSIKLESFQIVEDYATGGKISELFVLLLLDTFWRFLAGLPTNLWNGWLPRQRILSVHWPWRQGQLKERGKGRILYIQSLPQQVCACYTLPKTDIQQVCPSFMALSKCNLPHRTQQIQPTLCRPSTQTVQLSVHRQTQ